MGLKVIGIKKILAQVYLSNFSLLMSETSVLSKQCCKKKKNKYWVAFFQVPYNLKDSNSDDQSCSTSVLLMANNVKAHI